MIQLRNLTSHAQTVLQERATNAIERWQQEWCFCQHVVSATVAPQTLREQGATYFVDQKDRGAILAIQEEPVAWKALVFGKHLDEAPTDDICKSLIEAASMDLFNKIFLAITDRPHPVILEQVVGEAELRPLPISSHCFGTEVVDMSLMIGTHHITLAFPFHIANGIKPEISAGRKSKLAALTVQKIQKSVPATVSLSFGSHRVSDICSLEVGDILLSQTSIHELFGISIGDSSIASGHLCRKGLKKALMLTKSGN